MSKRKKTVRLILLLTLFNTFLCGAGGASAAGISGSQIASSWNNSNSTTRSAKTVVDDAFPKVPPASKDWMSRIGAGAMLSPAFVGSRDYQLIVVPALKVTYRNSFFASVEDGVGYAVINRDGLRVGPIAKIAFGRKEDGDTPFRIAGGKTSALHGLGNLATTLEVGGFAEYRWSSTSTKIGLRKGLNGHEGLVGDIAIKYTRTSQSLSPVVGSPIVVSFGPRLTLVDSAYNKAFFGVHADQTVNSGLPRYSPGGGVLSYGVGSLMVVPIRKHVSVALLAGYDHLAGDAGSSPLVSERGSPNQLMLGVLLSYEFGFDCY